MAEIKAELRQKTALLHQLIADNGITIAAEPRQWSYPAPFEVEKSRTASDTYYAVYGSSETIQRLKKAGCLANSRPSVETEESCKAYLRNDLVAAYPDPIPFESLHALFSLSHQPDEPTVAFYHTENHAQDASQPELGDEDTLSYLIMSAKDAERLKYPLERLTDDDRHCINMHHIGRKVGHFAILPIRRSLADAIQRAHPDAIDLTQSRDDDPQAHALPVDRAMQHILMPLHHDTRFHKEATVFRLPTVKPVNQAPAKKSAPRPLADYTEALRPHVIGFQLEEHYNGNFSPYLMCKSSAEQHRLIQQMRDADSCIEGQELSLMRDYGNASSDTMRYRINQATYTRLRESFPQASQHVLPSRFSPTWLTSRQIKHQSEGGQIFTQRESIEQLRLATVQEGSSRAHWLIARAPSTARLEDLRSSMGIDPDKTAMLTSAAESPALMRIALTAPQATQLLAQAQTGGQKLRLTAVEKPYPSLDALHVAERDDAQVSKIPAHIGSSQPSTPAKRPAKSETPPSVPTVREAAARLLFDKAAVTRLWAQYTPKKNKPLQWCLGLKIPSEVAPQFEKTLAGTGFLKLPDRRLVSLGRTGHIPVYQLYELQLAKEDAHAWEHHRTQDETLDTLQSTQEGQGNHSAMRKKLTEHFKEDKPSIDPVQEAWKHVAGLANAEKLQYVEIRFSGEDLQRMKSDFDSELALLKSMAGMHGSTEKIASKWHQESPLFLRPELDKAFGELKKTLRDRFNGSLREMQQQVAETEQLMTEYYRWLDAQPKQPDGSVVLPHLLVANPRGSTEHHLQQLRAYRLRTPSMKKDDPGIALLSDSAFSLSEFVGLHHPMLLQPVRPEFFPVLHDKGATITALTKEPVLLSELPGYLKERFPAPQQEVESKKPSPTNVVDIAEGERQRLLKGTISKNSSLFRFVSLREEHQFTDLAESRERIGSQPALVFNITSKSDWTQKIKPMLEELDRAEQLARRTRFGELTNAMPTDIRETQARIDALKEQRGMLHDADFLLHAQRVRDGKDSEEFHLNALREAVTMFDDFDPANDPPELKECLTFLTELRGKDTWDKSDVAQLYDIAERAHQKLQRATGQLNTRLQDLYDHHKIENIHASSAVTIQQDNSVLFYTSSDAAGQSLEALGKTITKHFTSAGAHAPLRFVAYLDKGVGPEADRRVLEALRKTHESAPALGRWTGRETAPRIDPATPITLRELFSHAPGLFPGGGTHRG